MPRNSRPPNSVIDAIRTVALADEFETAFSPRLATTKTSVTLEFERMLGSGR